MKLRRCHLPSCTFCDYGEIKLTLSCIKLIKAFIVEGSRLHLSFPIFRSLSSANKLYIKQKGNSFDNEHCQVPVAC